MFSRFLLFMALSCCVCGFELNVVQSSYQAQEMDSITLDWTITPKPQDAVNSLTVLCSKFKEGDYSLFFYYHRGVERDIYQHEHFLERVQFDKDKLTEGKISIKFSSLSTEDSGRYSCDVYLASDHRSARCYLNVTAARTQNLSEPGKNQIQTEAQEPDSGVPGRTALYWGLGTPFAVGLFLFYFLIIHPCLEKSLCQRRRIQLRGNLGPGDVEQTLTL